MENCCLFVFFTVTLTNFDVTGEVSLKITRERKEKKLRRHASFPRRKFSSIIALDQSAREKLFC